MSGTQKRIKLKEYEESESESDEKSEYHGYERLQDDNCETVSVIVHCGESDYSVDNQCNNTADNYNINDSDYNVEKSENNRIKISLSQEQIKNNCVNEKKGFLVVPEVKKGRSASFAAADRKSLSLLPEKYKNPRHSLGKIPAIVLATPITMTIQNNTNNNRKNSGCDLNVIEKLESVQVSRNSLIVDNSRKTDQVIYDVPRKHSLFSVPERKISNLTLSYATPSISLQTINNPASSFNINFRHPDQFYCKIGNHLMKDPRVLECFHSFCLECLMELDRSNNPVPTTNFWRKISENSELEWNFSVTGKTDQEPSLMSRSSIDSDNTRNLSLFSDKRSSFSSNKGRKFFKNKSPTRQLKGHTSSIVSFSDKPKAIVCPTCNVKTELSVYGIHRLPQNLILSRKIKEFTSRSEQDINKITCNLCAEFAHSECVTCGIHLCSFCKEAHKRQRHTSNHDIKILIDKKSKKCKSAEKVNDSKSIKCPIHPNLDLKLFCTNCSQVICSDCTILLHRNHKMISISKASKVYIKIIRDELQKTRPMSNYAIHSISKLNDLSKKVHVKCEQVENDVEHFLAEYFEALEVHKKTLFQQISRARETKLDLLRAQQQDLERRSNEAKTVISFTEELLSEGSELETLVFVSPLLKKFQQCRKSEHYMDIKISESLQFLSEVKAPSNSAQNNIPVYGIITTQTPHAKYCLLETTQGLLNLRVNKKAELILLTRDTDDRPMCHGAANVVVEIKYRDVSFKTLPVQISDKRDGTYTITFLPDVAGVIYITIHVNGKQIRDSPFTVRARNLRPHCGIYHCCAFCSSKGSKHVTCACPGVMGDHFNSCGHGWPGHPGHRHWSCCGSVLENSECSIANAIITDIEA